MSLKRLFNASAFLLMLTLGASLADAQTFHDDFNGTALDTTIWTADPGDGHVVVANGAITLSTAGSVFPVVTSRADPFPPGDFVVTVAVRYDVQAHCGDGFGATDNFWEDYYGTACRPFLLWEDQGGLYVYSGSAGASLTLPAPAPETGYHVYRWIYLNGQYEFSMDGVVGAVGGCAPRPTGIFFGHPHPINCGPWTSFSIDYIDIAPFGSTSSHSKTWGQLKSAYR